MSMALLPAVPAFPATATLIVGLHVGITMEFFSLTAIATSSALSTIGIIITGITITDIINTTGPTKLRLDVSYS